MASIVDCFSQIQEIRRVVSKKNRSHSDGYRADIDGLRALAVVSVLLFHYYPSILPGGYVGVDVFFVISRYLISNLLFADFNKDRFSIVEFYRRRIRRIFPALLLLLISGLILGF